MDYEQITNVDELLTILQVNPLGLKKWYKIYPFGKLSDNPAIRDKVLVGKPIIAAFLGISEKTLKRWFKKYPELPVLRTTHRCYALTNNLMLWKVAGELDRSSESLLRAARSQMYANIASQTGVTKKYFIETYVTKSRYTLENQRPHKRLRHKRFYRKTIDRTIKLLLLRHLFLNPDVDFEALENLHFCPYLKTSTKFETK